MVKVTYTGLLGSYQYLTDSYSTGAFELQTPTDKKAIFIDGLMATRVVFGGKGFDFDGDAPVSGKIKSVTFENAEGADFVKVSGGEFKLKQLVDILVDDGVEALIKKLCAGKDTVTGSGVADPLYGYGGNDTLIGGKAEDLINGGKGNDTLTGGNGPDMFVFYRGADKDTITDFDAKGGEGRQDFLYMNQVLSFTEREIKGGIVVDFGQGDEVTLLGVTKHDFSRADILLREFDV
ncbi:hypothetical protein [Rhizobium sp.]